MPSSRFYDGYMDEAIKALDAAGVSMADVPEEIRRETFNLEPLMILAERKGDAIKYMAIVNKWRDLFLSCEPSKPIEEIEEKERKPWQKQQRKEVKQLSLLT